MPLKVTKTLARANEYLEEGQYEEVHNYLRPWFCKDLNEYSQAHLWFMTGLTYYQEDKIEDFIAALEKVLSFKEISYALEDQSRFSLIRIYRIQKDYAKALAYLEKYMRHNKPSMKSLLMKVDLLYLTGKSEESFEYALKAKNFAEREKYPQAIHVLLNRIAYLHHHFGKIDDAINSLHEYSNLPGHNRTADQLFAYIDFLKTENLLLRSKHTPNEVNAFQQAAYDNGRKTAKIQASSTNPIWIKNPIYPEEALKAFNEATVVVSYDVDETGKVINLNLKETASEQFDKACVDAVKTFEYPAIDPKKSYFRPAQNRKDIQYSCSFYLKFWEKDKIFIR